jgi:hypothetical protein
VVELWSCGAEEKRVYSYGASIDRVEVAFAVV